MRMIALFAPILTFLLAGPAHAHAGHLADVAGHDHWVIGAALGAIALAGILGALKGRTSDDDDEAETEGEPA